MSNVLIRMFYHIVWTTKYRYPFITGEIEKHLRDIIPKKAAASNATAIALGMDSDHCHIVAVIPPAQSVSVIVGKLKGSSSHYLNKEIRATKEFDWQDGYAVFTVSQRELARVIAYVQNQREHHRRGTIQRAHELPHDDNSSAVR